MAERMIKCLPREATSPVVSQLHPSFRTTVVREQARSDFGETVGAVLDSISAFPLIPAPVRAVIQAVRTTVVSVARAVWDYDPSGFALWRSKPYPSRPSVNP